MKIIADTREQEPFTFEHERYGGVVVSREKLDTGDYSLPGLTDKVAVERKSLPDLIACLSHERERFERELQRAAALDAFAVVIEASRQDVVAHNYRSKMLPHAILKSILAFSVRYSAKFFFSGSRSGAEYDCYGFLEQYYIPAKKRLKEIVDSQEESAA